MTSSHHAERANPHPADLIAQALAGLEAGGQNIEEGGGESGPPLYESAEPGWILGVETNWNKTDQTWRRCLAHRYYVDHVGPGRKEALPIYLEALQAAGLKVSIGPLHEGRSKQVIWLEGRYDHLGYTLT